MALSISTGHSNGLLTGSGLNTMYASGKLLWLSGTAPANADAAQTGTLLDSITLPATPFTITGKVASLTGTWQGTAAANGTAGYFRLVGATDDGTSSTTQKRIQGTITATGGGGDMTLDSVSITSGGTCTESTFSLTMP